MSKSNEQEALSGRANPAQPLSGPHAAELRASALPLSSQPLAVLNGRRITVKLPIGGRTVMVQGLAAYEPPVGLRICFDDEALTELHLDEASWNGRVVPDTDHGSDFLIALDARAELPQTTR